MRDSEETKQEARERLTIGLAAVARLASFSPFIFGPSFTAADCVAYVHFFMIRQTSMSVFDDDMLERLVPKSSAYMRMLDARPNRQSTMMDRDAALAAFVALNVKYDG